MKHFDVPEMIRKAASAPGGLSAIDAVMGENWAHLELGSPMAGPAQRVAFRKEISRTEGASIGVSIAGRKPSAMVKLIGKGGAKNLAGLTAQMNYLSRNGDIELNRSEDKFGIPVDDVQRQNIADQWGLSDRTANFDRSSHFVVSFPAGADKGAAERVGRAWAAEMFESGKYGDTWDYYTAFHADTDNPHMHVVVGRSGRENDRWLKVSRFGDINYDLLRSTQAELAMDEGIELDASPRFARGEHQRPVPDAEYRLAEKEGRAPVAPDHTLATATLAAASVLHYAREFQEEAYLLEEDAPEAARQLQEMSDALGQGVPLTGIRSEFIPDREQEILMDATIKNRRDQILNTIAEGDAVLSKIDDPATRAEMERYSSEIKHGLSQYFPNNENLQAHTTRASDQNYEGLPSEGGNESPAARAARAQANIAVRQAAIEAGLDPDIAVARFSGPAATQGLSDDWAARERDEIASARGIDTPTQADMVHIAAVQDEFHAKAGEAYGSARETAARERAPEAEGRETPGNEPTREKPVPQARDTAERSGPVYDDFDMPVHDKDDPYSR